MNHKQQLIATLKASGWSQEQLAHELEVSFATLNSWINGRSQPRQKALQRIEKTYSSIVGTNDIDESTLQAAKQIALQTKMSVRKILNDTNMLDKLTLYLTYHTNTIEGSTMTLSDVEDVLFDHKVLANRTAIEQTEARNHQATLHWLLDQLSAAGSSLVIDENLILGIHLRLMNGIISDAGHYRKHAVRIMGSRVVVANWLKVTERMQDLLTAMNKPSEDLIAGLAKTHAQFEQIHPFSDGNGRTGRLLLLMQALRAGMMPPLVLKERKYAYYKYLEIAQTDEQYAPLEFFIAESIQASKKLLEIS